MARPEREDEGSSAAPRAVLLTIPNHHRRYDGGKNHPPEFNADDDFVAYMPNHHGEQMVFVLKRCDQHGHLYHGDLAWSEAEVRLDGDGAHCEGIILNRAEIAFLTACMAASSELYGPDSTS
jgi:hypothetical protein